jgi:hypothetical protein
MSDCRRTPAVIDRLVDGRITDEDRRHAATCPDCGPVLARAASFDDELCRSARALVAEELPRGILEQALTGRPAGVVARRAAPGLTAIIVAVAVLLTATIIAVGPGTSPAVSPTPGTSPTPGATPTGSRTGAPFVERFQSTAAIVGQLTKLDYACNDGGPVPSPGPEPDAVTKEAAVCTAPDSAGPYLLVVIVGEGANGKVVELTVKGDVPADTTENRGLFTLGIAKVLSVALRDEAAGQNGGSWAKVHVAELNPGEDVVVVLRQVLFRAERLPNASYHLVVRASTAS